MHKADQLTKRRNIMTKLLTRNDVDAVHAVALLTSQLSSFGPVSFRLYDNDAEFYNKGVTIDLPEMAEMLSIKKENFKGLTSGVMPYADIIEIAELKQAHNIITNVGACAALANSYGLRDKVLKLLSNI
jgi:hypothetical protein